MRRADKFSPGETLARDIGPKLNHMVDLINRDIKGDSRTVRVQELGNTITVSAIRQPGGGGGGGGAQSTPFFWAATAHATAGTVAIAAGRMINGTAAAEVNATTHAVGTANGVYYLYIQIWYNAAWKSSFASSTTYPTQAVINDGGTDYPCYRRLIAKVTIAANVVSEIAQAFDAEIVNPNICE